MTSKNRKHKNRLQQATPEIDWGKARPFDGMEIRQGGPKPWPPGKPPGGKLPPEAKPSARNHPAES